MKKLNLGVYHGMGCFAKPCLVVLWEVANLSASARSPMKNCTTKHVSSTQRWYKWRQCALCMGWICWIKYNKLHNMLLSVLCKILFSIAHSAPCIEQLFCTWLVREALLPSPYGQLLEIFPLKGTLLDHLIQNTDNHIFLCENQR